MLIEAEDQKEESEVVYETSDLAFAAFLLSKEIRLTSTRRDFESPVRVLFSFSDANSSIKKMKDQFIRRECLVEPISFMSNVKYLKSLINAEM